MVQPGHRPRRRPGGVDAALVGFGTLSADASSPPDVLAGFDAVVQFSGHLLETQLAQSLAAKGLSLLTTRTLWQPALAPPLLRAAVAAKFHHIEVRPGVELEVRLLTPTVAEMTWPVTPDGPDVPVEPTRSRRKSKEAANGARAVDRRVQVAWQLEINLIVASLQTSVEPQSGGSGPGYQLDRTLLGRGLVQVAAVVELTISRRWLFGMELEFGHEAAVTRSDEPMVAEFLADVLGKAMIAEAVGLVAGASGVKLTPTIAPAGPLSQPQVDRLILPALQVRDVLLTDPRGERVLSLCVDIGSPASGVPTLVSPFLERNDFAYASSIALLGRALKARWDTTATGLFFVGEVPVELPISEDSAETATGLARVHVSIAGVLDDAAVCPSVDQRGDPVRLLSKQTIRLLGLWDYRGRRFTDLGPLAEPRVEAFVLPLNLFDPSPTLPSSALHPDFERFVFKQLAIMVYPLVEHFRIKGVTGFTSSAAQLLLTRWSLRTPADEVRPPVGGVVIQGTM